MQTKANNLFLNAILQSKSISHKKKKKKEGMGGLNKTNSENNTSNRRHRTCLTSLHVLPLNILIDAIPEKTSVKPRSSLLAAALQWASADSSDRKRLDLPEPAGALWISFTEGPGPWQRGGVKLSLKAIHWLCDQDTEEKASTLFGGLEGGGLLTGSKGSAGPVMGALWARAGTGLRVWKGVSGESQGEDVDEEKEDKSLDGRFSVMGGEGSGRVAVSAEERNVIDRVGKQDKDKAESKWQTFSESEVISASPEKPDLKNV